MKWRAAEWLHGFRLGVRLDRYSIWSEKPRSIAWAACAPRTQLWCDHWRLKTPLASLPLIEVKETREQRNMLVGAIRRRGRGCSHDAGVGGQKARACPPMNAIDCLALMIVGASCRLPRQNSFGCLPIRSRLCARSDCLRRARSRAGCAALRRSL